VTVPLDRSGRQPGTVRLKVERVKGRPRRPGVLLALAGGPGQAAVPLAEAFAQVAAAGLRRHEIVVFDQRGTGSSGLLRCPSVEPSYLGDLVGAGASCAARLGPRRALYTTRDSVEDIEAVRQALGVERISLLGVSYGTKVALGYAMAHPEHVERLVLDSVVTPEGPDVYGRSSFAAVPGALRDACRAHRCRGITPDAVRDLAVVAGRVRTAPMRGFVVGPRGRRNPAKLRTSGLLTLLFSSDLDPTLLPAIPAALRSARRGDPAPVLRLLHVVAAADDPGSPSDLSSAVLVATLCEESAFPWARTAGFDQRRDALGGALQALGDGPFAPFDGTAAIALYAMPICYAWPAAPDPPDLANATRPLPAVPTLMIEGSRDLRTPVSDARALAARMPDARLTVATGAGHSVLGTVQTACPGSALRAFMAGRPVRRRCGRDPLQDVEPDPLAPARLGEVPPVPGVSGHPGRTLTAALLTMLDGVNSLLDPLFQALLDPAAGSVVRAGGLRAGWLELRDSRVLLHGLVYVPGVRVGGQLTLGDDGFSALLRVSGRAASRGVVHISRTGAITGQLGGRRLHLPGAQAGAAAYRGRPLLARVSRDVRRVALAAHRRLPAERRLPIR
jgi:pimeloyl-ACP methyl ester carboxylesterase